MICTAEGCDKTATRLQGRYCEAHYMRLYRTGGLALRRSRKPVLSHSGGYRILYAPEHPLAQRLGREYEYEHRVVFYNEHGSGPFLCHVCGEAVGWPTMHVDHLNDRKADNRPENLAPAHPVCNRRRAQERGRRAIAEAVGRWIECGGERDTLSGWARRLGISHSSIAARLAAGWPIERALTAPRGRFGPIGKLGGPARDFRPAVPAADG